MRFCLSLFIASLSFAFLSFFSFFYHNLLIGTSLWLLPKRLWCEKFKRKRKWCKILWTIHWTYVVFGIIAVFWKFDCQFSANFYWHFLTEHFFFKLNKFIVIICSEFSYFPATVSHILSVFLSIWLKFALNFWFSSTFGKNVHTCQVFFFLNISWLLSEAQLISFSFSLNQNLINLKNFIFSVHSVKKRFITTMISNN